MSVTRMAQLPVIEEHVHFPNIANDPTMAVSRIALRIPTSSICVLQGKQRSFSAQQDLERRAANSTGVNERGIRIPASRSLAYHVSLQAFLRRNSLLSYVVFVMMPVTPFASVLFGPKGTRAMAARYDFWTARRHITTRWRPWDPFRAAAPASACVVLQDQMIGRA